MKSLIHPLLHLVVAACVILLACTAYVHFFWLRCGGLDIHAWPNHILCWYLPEFIAGTVGLIGLTAGYLSREKKSLAVTAFAALMALVAFSIQSDFPFGSGSTYLSNGLLYIVLPAIIGGVFASFILTKRRKNAL